MLIGEEVEIYRKLHKEQACLECGKNLDSAIGGQGKPRPGDVAVCSYCGNIMAYSDDFSFRELTDEEQLEVAGDPNLLLMMEMSEAFRQMIENRKKREENT